MESIRRLALLVLGIALAAAGCGGAEARPWVAASQRDTHDDPATVRPGYCNADLHLWWPLTAPEASALAVLDKAKAGDAHALLALAILASGSRRDEATYDAYQHRVDNFVADARAAVDGAVDDWHRGYELNRAMHHALFTGGAGGELGSYELDQSRVAGIFDTGRQNCISSAMLFAVLARSFGMPVRGVLVPTHAFIEMGPPDAKSLEVETTTDRGFDWVHDERFFREGASKWSSSRGLRPVTLAEYEHRDIVEPYRLMAAGMAQQAWRATSSKEDRHRLIEVAGVVDPESVEWQRSRAQDYLKEADDLFKAGAQRTIVKMFDCVGPSLSAVLARTKEPETLRSLAWGRWYYANALEVAGRGDEPGVIADDAIDRINPAWEDSEKLRENFYGILVERMLALMAEKQFAAAAKVVQKHLEGCRAMTLCNKDLDVVYQNWSVDYRNRSGAHRNAGDWQAARQVLTECVAQLPDDAGCRDDLRDLESRHRF